ncbi:MAG: pyrimidine 5'-nucleotidase [Rhodospirillales bacterium]|jgi:putative hydrolase of the HAD superfamily|nr:pyrimidine 5'-nucleotidase [Rhodospirillaceae bacterium]MDP6426704.1 pyrimidine 5'-nucleotidase [Rhodospirillales bacterium]MDP6642497.1 pyrimidine 5'-nucleotidase [Rhodospirillales bacterium]MDP6841439.1 pyrimidine 5'-nucleotidase [Rhodospirillales bacterium]|tara:strand:- start:873 stop:1541 length:669 start_codon:yes stop_codon:yes gene_type:complete
MTALPLKDYPYWVFDLDNTLYPVGANLFEAIDKRMCGFIADYLDIGHAEAYRLQKQYFREHGTTLRGLMDCHGMEPGPYLEYVHSVDLAPVKRDSRMDRALDQLPGRKFVFTNATLDYARRVLDKIGIARHFDDIFDIEAADFIPKPEPRVYERMQSRFGIDPVATVMVEDVARNLGPAAAMGMTTVWVMTGRPWAHAEAADHDPHHRTDNLTEWLAGVAGI